MIFTETARQRSSFSYSISCAIYTIFKQFIIFVIIFYINFINNKIKAGAAAAPSEGDSLARLPYLRTWFRTRSAICLWLSNGSIQINWFEVCKIFCELFLTVILVTWQNRDLPSDASCHALTDEWKFHNF